MRRDILSHHWNIHAYTCVATIAVQCTVRTLGSSTVTRVMVAVEMRGMCMCTHITTAVLFRHSTGLARAHQGELTVTPLLMLMSMLARVFVRVFVRLRVRMLVLVVLGLLLVLLYVL